MSSLILYHYDLSPFSEKARLMLGYAGLPWRSVKVPEMPPRPTLEVLAGGYRKIPVAQIGADVYCDSKTIGAQIARLAGKPELDLDNCSEAARDFAHRVDLDIFMAIVTASMGGVLRRAWRQTSLRNVLRLVRDRIGVARQSRVPRLSAAATKEVIKGHLADLEARLEQDFLFGPTPCAADFSAYHSLWFACEMAGKPWLQRAPKLAGWYARMQAFGHGSARELTAEQALDQARDVEPATLDAITAGEPRMVSIAPADYARDPVTGQLVAESAQRWVLRREHPRVGRVHVHFPRQGFVLGD